MIYSRNCPIRVEQIKKSDAIPFEETRFEYETCATGNASMWAMSGGEIAEMDFDRSLAVSGLEETVTYLQKIEMGLFKDIEYIEFRTCREGCLGGVLTAIDKYLAKSAVQKDDQTVWTRTAPDARKYIAHV